MKNHIKNVDALTITAIEALKLAFQENPDHHASGLILAALAVVTKMRVEIAEMGNECCPFDPAEHCSSVKGYVLLP